MFSGESDDARREPATGGPPRIDSVGLGPETFAKRGWADEGRRVRHEAAVLSDARHPGVVEIMHVVDDDESCELHLAIVEGETLAETDPLRLDDLIRIVISVGRTLCDLHHRGVRHGNIRSDHVLVDRRGRTVLCGFGDAGRDGESGTPQVSADIAGFGRLILTELSKGEDSGLIDGEDRRAWAVRSLAEEAATVEADVDSLEEYVQRLAILASVEPSTRRRTATPWAATVGGVAAVAVVVLLLGFRLGSTDPSLRGAPLLIDDGSLTPDRAPPTTTTGTSVSTPVSTPRPQPTLLSASSPRRECPQIDPPDAAAVDLDGDDCPEAAVIEGNVIIVGDRRWWVGRDGDQILIGDFHCTGSPTPALVRPATGAVFIFDRWPTDTHPVQIQPSATLADPSTARVVRTDGCDRIVGDSPTGEVHVGPDGELAL